MATTPALSQTAQPQPQQGRGTNPLVRVTGLQQLLQREAETPPSATSIDASGPLSALAGHVRHAWGNNKLAKQKVELKLLMCLRERRGVYSPAQIASMQASRGGLNLVKADLTETKCRAASAWIREIVLPVGEQPWGVDPTPVPDLPDAVKKGLVQKAIKQANDAMNQIAQQGGGTLSADEYRALITQIGTKLRDDAETALVRAAEQRAKRMEKQIADRLDEGGYATAMDQFVEDFVTYPAAILKGPIYRRHKQLEWATGWKPKVSDNPHQTWERVSPFDAYPAPSARDCQVGDFIERIRFRREELHGLKGLPNYKDDQIDKALLDYSAGHLEGWLWTEAERIRLEQESMYMWLSPPGVIDALNYWGSIPGWKLMSWGVTDRDGLILEETRDYECNVLLCGSYVLYAAVNPDPLDQRPYHRACYDEIPGAFWGRSIPDLCSTSQQMCDGIACALADNLSQASGPMVWVHADRFADGEQTLDIFPWKVWQLKSDPTQGVNPGIGFWQADDRAANLMATYEKWELRADDASGIPRYTYGNERAGGSADTATGLSMLMNNAAKGLRRAISNIDINVTSRTIGMCFVNEMLYNPDPSIKGDCVPVPRGAAAILIKESAQQRRTTFLTMVAGNPLLAQLIGPKYLINLVREVATSMELPVDEVVPSEEEIDQQQAQQASAAQAQAQAQAALEQQSQAAQGERERQNINAQTVADIIKEAVAHALQTGAVLPPMAQAAIAAPQIPGAPAPAAAPQPAGQQQPAPEEQPGQPEEQPEQGGEQAVPPGASQPEVMG